MNVVRRMPSVLRTAAAAALVALAVAAGLSVLSMVTSPPPPPRTLAPTANLQLAIESTRWPAPDLRPDRVKDPSATLPKPIPYRDLVPRMLTAAESDYVSCAVDVVSLGASKFARGAVVVVGKTRVTVTEVIEVAKDGLTGYAIGRAEGRGDVVEIVWQLVPYSGCFDLYWGYYEMHKTYTPIRPGDPQPAPTPPSPTPSPVPAKRPPVEKVSPDPSDEGQKRSNHDSPEPTPDTFILPVVPDDPEQEGNPAPGTDPNSPCYTEDPTPGWCGL
jgi:hypothetical protein